MPIYEYVCEKCGEKYERIAPSSAAAVSCPKCGSKKGTLQFSVFSTSASGNGGARASAGSSAGPGSGGGCCGGSCGCH